MEKSAEVKQAVWDPGLEYLDPTPVAIPVGAQRPESLAQTMRRLIVNELSANAARVGLETFEESIDFDIDEADELDHTTMYEQAASMHEELLEGQHVERQLSRERELRSRVPGESQGAGVSNGERPGRARADDSRDGADDGRNEGGDSRVEVSVDRRAAQRSARVRGEGRRGSPPNGKDSARKYDED